MTTPEFYGAFWRRPDAYLDPDVLTMDELHLGYYVIVAEPASRTGGST